MYMYVCIMYVSMNVCMYVRIYTPYSPYVCTYVFYMYVLCMYVCMYKCIDSV